MEQCFLITGGAGFIGSHFVRRCLSAYPMVRIVNLDILGYAGSQENMIDFYDNPRHHFVKGDIRDSDLLSRLFEQQAFQAVFHFAAESHVDNSIQRPLSFVETNVLGTAALLEAARSAWLLAPHETREHFKQARFCHISTDEVYGSLGETGFFNEHSQYAPNSPYSASKAASDMMVRSYHHTYGLNTITTHCSNNFGTHQHAEKFIPTIVRRALNWQTIPIYGDGLYTRDWLYVIDHCSAILRCFEKGRAGEVYDIGARNEWNNLALVHLICDILDRKYPSSQGSYYSLIQQVADRPGHDRRYAIDSTKIETELGWKATQDFSKQLECVIEYYAQQSIRAYTLC